MTAEVSDASSESIGVFNATQDSAFETWNGREVSIEVSCERIDSQKEKLLFHKGSHGKFCTEMVVRAAPAPREWNHESFPIPPPKPILTPVPDGDTCYKYANSFKSALLRWIKKEEGFIDRGLMSVNDLSQIENILGMLVDDVENYVVMVGFYNSGIDWKEVLQPLNRLFQFWKYKWEKYGFPPSPYDYPLP